MSVLKSVRETISDLFESIEPPSDPVVGYRRHRQLATSDAPVGRRNFFFDLPTGGRETQWESAFTTIRSTFEISVAMTFDGRDNELLFDEVCDEAILLLNTINLAPSGTFAAGVNFVQATGWRLESAGDEIFIILSCQVETDEADGAP